MKDDYSYCTDGKNNYLILPSDYVWEGKNYQYRMLTGNKIDRILPCTAISVDGKEQLYYEITSRQSISDLYRNTAVTVSELIRLLNAVIDAGEKLGEYLLDYSGLVLDPEQIYYDFFKEDFQFIYYPAGSGENVYSELFHFLADKTESEDAEAAAGIYQLCAMAESKNFIMNREVMKKFFPEENTDRREVYGGDFEYEEDSIRETQECGKEWSRQDEEQEEQEEKNTGPIFLIAAGVLLAAGVVLEWLRETTLPIRYQLPSMAAAGGCCAAAVLAAVVGAVRILKHRRSETNRNDPSDARQAEEWKSGPRRQDHFAAESILYSGENHYRGRGIMAEESAEYVIEKKIDPEMSIEREPGFEKLHGIGKARGYHIELEQLPCTVGKIRKYTDYQIDEPSISGMHVRFYRSGDKIYMKDLNSTNGTFLNGKRLNPNAHEEIRPGDEIRLGILDFCYR